MRLDPNMPRPRALPWVMLILLTFTVMGGPLAILIALRGGESANWPPDRLGEWLVFTAACALVGALLLGTLLIALWNKRDWEQRMADYRRQQERDAPAGPRTTT